MGDYIWVVIEEQTPSEDIKFIVDKCYFATSPLDNATKDMWLEDGCPIDPTAEIITDPNAESSELEMKIKSFQFVNERTQRLVNSLFFNKSEKINVTPT